MIQAAIAVVMFTISLLYFTVTGLYLYDRNPLYAGVFLCYGVAGLLLWYSAK